MPTSPNKAFAAERKKPRPLKSDVRIIKKDLTDHAQSKEYAMLNHHDTTAAKIRDVIAFPAIVSVITLLISVIFAEVQNRIGWIFLAAAVICFLSIYVVTLLVVAIQYRPLCMGLFQQLRNEIIGLVDPDHIGIIDNEGLALVESAAKFRDIWLITGDLAEDVPSSPFYKTVHRNLRKGTNYTYFCPRLARTEGRVTSIRQAHGTTKGKLRFVFLSDDFFFLTPRLDFCIYDPFNLDGKKDGYMGLPMDTDKHLHGKMDSELIDSLVGKLKTYQPQEE